MKKNIVVAICVLLVLAVTVVVVAMSNQPEGKNTSDTVNSESNSSNNTSEAINQESVEEFHSVEINTMSPDVKIIEGDRFALEYKLHDREAVELFEVRDGVLRFDTTFQHDFDVDYGNFYLNVIVPQGTKLDSVHIETIAGQIYTNLPAIANAELVSVSGNIHVDDSRIENLKAKTTSSNISASGEIDTIEINSISGDCTVISKNLSGTVKTVSGKISLETDENFISAKSFGKVVYKGSNNSYRFENGTSFNLNIESTSGKITIK